MRYALTIIVLLCSADRLYSADNIDAAGIPQAAPPLVLPLCEERACIELDCSDFSLPGCECILGPEGLGLFCALSYPSCALRECDSLSCTIPMSGSCLCLRPPLPPIACTTGPAA